MVVKTRKQGNSISITIPSEFNIPSGVSYKVRLSTSGELIFTPEDTQTVEFASSDKALSDMDSIFEAYDDIFKALVER